MKFYKEKKNRKCCKLKEFDVRKTVSFTAIIGLVERGVKGFLGDVKLILSKNVLIIGKNHRIIVLLKTNDNIECEISMTLLL